MISLSRTLLLLLAGSLCGAALLSYLGPAGLSPKPAENTSQQQTISSGPASYAPAVRRAAPAVVNIFTNKVTTEQQTMEFKDPVMQHYYGRLLPEQTRQHSETNLGSGVVVHPDGYVLTNLHILEGADGIKVVLADGSYVKVHFVGKDPDTDLAVLKMDTPPSQAIPIGNSHELQVGDVVLAIGNPFGVGQTITMGIVSATGRTHLGISSFEDFIQTDAAINPGNSGGALVNAAGELVGINTAIFSNSGGSHGIGFAVPADIAMNVLDQIVHRGQVSRGWIGLIAQSVTPARREAFGLKADSGVMVSGSLQDGPAEQSELRAGDVITHIDKRTVADVHDLQELIANAGPGRELILSGLRGSEQKKWRVTTEQRPEQPKR